MKQNKTILRSARAALLLVAALLTNINAWAQTTETVSYIDADGTQKTVTATVLTGDITQSGFELNGWGSLLMPAGWYVVKNSNADGVDASCNTDIKATGDQGTINIILADGAEMTVNGGGSFGFDLGTDPLAIYGQSAGTGRLTVSSSSRAIYSSDDITINGGIVSATSSRYEAISSSYVTINGGQVTATGGEKYVGIRGTITLGCRKLTDFIKSNGFYGGIVTIKSGQTLYDGNTAYSGTLSTAQWSALANSTLRPFSSDDLAVNDDNTEYTIHTATGWGLFCDMLAQSDKGVFSGKTVKLDADITVTRMAGSDYHDFTGTFDGQGHTLTFNHGEDGNPANDEYAAPFRNVDGCTIKNLHVAGDIYTSAKYAAGLVAQNSGELTAIVNCLSSVNIHSTVSGDGTHGGFVAAASGQITITGCAFNGRLLGAATEKVGGFIGWRNSGAEIRNSLFIPAEVTVKSDGSATFARNKVDTYNCYYTYPLFNSNYNPSYAPYDPADTEHPDKYNNGLAPLSVTAADAYTDVAVSPVGEATQTYTVSHITAYAKGITRTVGSDATFYYGQGDAVSLSLSNTAEGAPLGYEYSQYTVGGGATLSGTTLTMGSGDATVSVDTSRPRSTRQAVSIAYVLADGTAQEAQAIALDGTETTLAAGNYFVGIAEANFDHTVTLSGNVSNDGEFNLILNDGCTMNVGTSGSRLDDKGIKISNKANLTIFGQTNGTGTLGVYTSGGANDAISVMAITINGGNVIASTDGIGAHAIRASWSDLTINGGNVTAYCTGTSSHALWASNNVAINGGIVNATGGSSSYGIKASGTSGTTITLGWTNPTDRITASSYGGTVSVATADGHKLYDGNGNYLRGTVSDLAAVNGKTLQPALSTAYITAQGTAADDPADAIVLSPDQTTLGAHNYVALGTLNYTQTGLTLTGNATLILADGCQMNVGTSSERINGTGFYDSSDLTFTITSESLGDDMGALSVYNTGNYNHGITAGTLTINGGNITADTNGNGAIALFAEYNVTINGGTVIANATGTGDNAFAIYAYGDFNYNGGNVTATAAHANAITADGNHYTFNWRTPDDRITIGASGLYATDGTTATFTSTMTDGLGHTYTGTIDADGLAALNALAASNDGLTLQPGNSLAAHQAPDGNYWTTYYNGAFGHVIPDQENACAYTATYANGQLTLHRLGTDGKTIPADCAVIIVADNPEVSMTVTDADPFTGTNDLDGVDQDTPLDDLTATLGDGTFYVLGMTTVNTANGPEKHFGFHRYTGTEMAARKAFLMLPAGDPNQARSLDMVFGDETGIKTTNFTNLTNSDEWYTLDGRKLTQKPAKAGLYINKGIKVVIK